MTIISELPSSVPVDSRPQQHRLGSIAKKLGTALLVWLFFGSSPALADCPAGYSSAGPTCVRAADSMSNGGSRVADCPAGYTNNGLACGRAGDSMSNGGSRVADCPAGYTNNGLTCGRGADSMSRTAGGSCPGGYGNWGTFCVNKSFGWGSTALICPPGYSNSGGICYTGCPSGWTNMGLTCLRPVSTLGLDSMVCKPGEFFSTGRCYQPCPAGYTNTGVSCYKPPSTLGLETMTCGANEFFSTGRCFKPCPTGYTNSGVSCFRPPDILPQTADIRWNAPQSEAIKKVWNIAHMVTTNDSVTWAVGQGANALEMDVHFDKSSGVPIEFRHGGMCDCTCTLSPDSDHVCSRLKSCEASAPIADHLNHIAQFNIGMVYIDSKVDGDKIDDQPTMEKAGKEIINALERNLFRNRYKGFVVVSAPSSKYLDYLNAAKERAIELGLSDRVYYVVDMDNGGQKGAINTTNGLKRKLQSSDPNKPLAKIFSAAGITTCVPYIQQYEESTQGVNFQISGDVRGTNVWSIDKENSMKLYLGIGVRGIVTNRPGVLKNIISESGLSLHTPGYLP